MGIQKGGPGFVYTHSGAMFLMMTVLSLRSYSFINSNHCWVSFSGWSVTYNETFGQASTSRGIYLEIHCCTRTVTFQKIPDFTPIVSAN